MKLQYVMKRFCYYIYNLFFAKFVKFAADRYMETRFKTKYLVYGKKDRLQISKSAVINNAFFNTISGDIVIEDFAFFGLNVTLLTGTHDYTKFGHERQNAVPEFGRDIIIKEGAWLANNVIVVGPCIIGEHAVVAAGSMVNKNVSAYTIVGGVPARFIKNIPLPPPVNEESAASTENY